jgi:hypothetical protein
MKLPEETKKLTYKKRQEIIKGLAGTQVGQALREELVYIMNDVGNVSRLTDADFENNEVLSAEVRGMLRAKRYLQGVYNKLIPMEEEKIITKKHK